MIAEALPSIKRVVLTQRHCDERSDDLSAVALAKADDPGRRASGTMSLSRKARPSIPPKLARKSVERLPRTTGTSIPREIASQHRQPI
jgi:hypothetical protein